MSEKKNDVSGRLVKTARLGTYVLEAGPKDGYPVVFLHGNCSDSRFFKGTLGALPERFRGVAPDLRGFGQTAEAPIDATRGMRDFADDLHALIEDESVFGADVQAKRPVLLVAHSAGAGVAMQYAIDHPERVGGLVLVAPLSPYGFGGTRDIDGTPCWPDFAGSGGGTANPEYVARLSRKDRSNEPLSPRHTMNECFVKPPFRAPNEEELLDSVLSTRVSDDNYPGDSTTSENWPGVAPGTRGMNNAMSPKYLNLSSFADVPSKPPVLWVRGDSDVIVSDTSLFDFGYLGQLGAVPGWPGADAYPPQPMVSQMRAVLDRYIANGGSYREVVMPETGHSPQIERPADFEALLFPFLVERAG